MPQLGSLKMEEGLVHSLGKRRLTVDIDVHIHEKPEELAEYSEMPWKRALLAIKDVPERYLDIPGLSPSTPDEGVDPPFPGGQPLRFVRSAAQMRSELDDLGIDVGIIFPDHLLKIALFPNVDYAMALARAYNRWLARKCIDKDRKLFGAICVAPQDPAGSAEEISKMRGDGNFIAIYLPVAGLQRLYGHREYDPIYEIAEKHGIPLVLHSVSAIHSVFPFQLEQYPNAFARHALAHPLAMIANLIHMISTGVPVRFPKLKVVFAEGAISWVPWVMMRLDKEYLERRREVPFLEERPSHYIKRFCYGTQPIEEPEKASDYVKLVELMGGPESILFSSDWPHHDFDHPRKILSYPMPEDWKDKIMGENAARIFNLKGS